MLRKRLRPSRLLGDRLLPPEYRPCPRFIPRPLLRTCLGRASRGAVVAVVGVFGFIDPMRQLADVSVCLQPS